MALCVSTGRERCQGDISLIIDNYRIKVLINVNILRVCQQTIVVGFSAVQSWPRLPSHLLRTELFAKLLKLLLTACKLERRLTLMLRWAPLSSSRKTRPRQLSSQVLSEIFCNSSRHFDQRRHYTCIQFVQYFFPSNWIQQFCNQAFIKDARRSRVFLSSVTIMNLQWICFYNFVPLLIKVDT